MENKTAEYIAYQYWQPPSWSSNRELIKKVYGRGSTPDEALWDARYFVRPDGQTQQRDNAPNLGDLHTEEAR